jgi:uncharacterized repeat protein (TIGR03803 family)
MRSKLRLNIFLIAFAVAGLACSAGTRAFASSFTVAYGFCSVANCVDGESPIGNLVRDSSGHLYGVTGNGGSNGGVVFELIPSGSGWTERVLYHFCYDGSCEGGALPAAGLVMDSAGNLYGTTASLNEKITGTIFELTPDAQHEHWKLNVLHEFCKRPNCTDGAAPSGLTYSNAASGLPYDGVSPLYGTTQNGGRNASGTVFQLAPSGQGSSQWKYTILHQFCARACKDFGFPKNGVIVDGTGNLYGTTDGTLFELSPHKPKWKIKTLHKFCSGNDGCDPAGSLLLAADGNLYGVTRNGGNRTELGGTAGVAYKLILSTGAPQYSLLYKFCSVADCSDGYNPLAGLSMDSSGNLFGTTFAAGGSVSGEDGALFSLSPKEKVLHAFCLTDCKDGSEPEGGLLLAPNGHVFGTTWQSGPHNGGEVFEYIP